MDLTAAFAFINSHGMQLLRLFASQSPHDIVGFGMELKTAKNIINTAKVYFGPTDSPRKQQDAIALAESRGVSLDRVLAIEFYAKQLKSTAGSPGSCGQSLSRTKAASMKFARSASRG